MPKSQPFKLFRMLFSRPLLLKGLASLMFIVFFIMFAKGLGEISWEAVRSGFLTLSISQMFLASSATLLSFLILGLIEHKNFHSIGFPVKVREAFYISWTVNAISNHFSFAGLSGVAVRIRHLEKRKISTEYAVYLTLLNSVTLWIGYSITLFTALFFYKFPEVHLNHVPTYISEILMFGAGAFLLLFLLLYSAWGKRLVEKKWNVELPPVQNFAFRFLLAAGDWVASCFALYALMPQSFGVGFGPFLVIFLAAQLLGVIFNVPGGMGVLEIIILSIDFGGNSSELLGSLVFFRLIYYLIPLAFCLLSFGVGQMRDGSPIFFSRFKNLFDNLGSHIAPALAATFFIQGFLIITAKRNSFDPLQMLFVSSIVPLHIVELIQAFLPFLGVLLAFLSVGIFLKSHLAWAFSLMTAGVGSICLAFGGMSLDQSGYLLISAIPLLFYKRIFFRSPWIYRNLKSLHGFANLSLLIAIIITISNAADPTRSPSSADDSLISIHNLNLIFSGHFLMAVTFLAGALLIRLMWPTTLAEANPKADPIPAEVWKIVEKSMRSLSQLAFVGDKKFFFNPERTAFIMYIIKGTSWIAMGDPIGPGPKKMIGLFLNEVERLGGYPLFYQVHREQIAEYYDFNLKIVKVGEEALIDLQKFSLQGPSKHSLRNSFSRVAKKGVEFKIFAPGQFLERRDEFQTVSDQWLQQTRGHEKGFSLGHFDENYLAKYFHAVLLKDDKIVAFANIWKTTDHTEISVDLMRYSAEAPSGAMDYLFLCLIKYAQERGYKTFNLGMSPLSGLEQSQSPLWNLIGAFLFENGDRFYNFQGVRRFKDKFGPQWESRYVAYKDSIGAAAGIFNVILAITQPKLSAEDAKKEAA